MCGIICDIFRQTEIKMRFYQFILCHQMELKTQKGKFHLHLKNISRHTSRINPSTLPSLVSTEKIRSSEMFLSSVLLCQLSQCFISVSGSAKYPDLASTQRRLVESMLHTETPPNWRTLATQLGVCLLSFNFLVAKLKLKLPM